jgi:hypothetical protein
MAVTEILWDCVIVVSAAKKYVCQSVIKLSSVRWEVSTDKDWGGPVRILTATKSVIP